MNNCDFSLKTNIDPNAGRHIYDPNLEYHENQHHNAYTCASSECVDYDGECIKNKMLDCLKIQFGEIYDNAVWKNEDFLTCREFTFTTDSECFTVYFLHENHMMIFTLCFDATGCY